MMRNLENKCALVTGSSQGIGQQVILGLSKHRCNVVIHGRKLSSLNNTIDRIKKYDVKYWVVTGDFSSLNGVNEVIKGVKDGPGHIDILYNNAATLNTKTPLMSCSLKEWEKVFKVNFFSVVELCKAFVPYMVKQKFGRIINVTSRLKNLPELTAYSSSKAAVNKFTLELASELTGTNVLANTLDPGWLKTDLGGADAPNNVESVLPGAIIPALLEDYGSSGKLFKALDYRHV